MAITVSFQTSQVVGNPQNIVLVDTSQGTDVTAVARRIFIATQSGSNLVPSGTTTNYILWPLGAGSTITLNVLAQDSALNVTLEYVNVSGGVVAFDTVLEGFTLYNETFYYSLTQAQAMQNQPPPMIIQDSDYFTNKSILRTQIDDGNQAIALGNDITTAQAAYDRATYMVSHQQLFF